MTESAVARWVRGVVCLVFLVAIGTDAFAGDTIRADLDPGVAAVLKAGRQLFLECRLPQDGDAEAFFGQYLAASDEWRVYKDRIAVAIAAGRVKAEVRRRMLLALFPEDYVDDAGWWHTAICSETEGQESLWALCEWLAGKGTLYRKVLGDARNHLTGAALKKGDRVLVPACLLLPEMKECTVPKPPPDEPKSNGEEQPVDLDVVASELSYGSDGDGAYAMYRLKQGEALYTAVVVRFTDTRDNDAILKACEVVQRRSGIKNVREMKTGQKILIPIEMLSARFAPKGSEQRKDFEQTLVEAKRLRQEQVRTKDLEGVVVVIDPGHGGRDHGAAMEKIGLYEDEINYDIACRVKKILESQTRAKVYMTVRDKRQGYEPVDKTVFVHDANEEILTTPPYDNWDAKVSANLRWYLANAIYRDAIQNGADPRKIVFTSFHTDAQFNPTLRGAMIYIPGAKYRRDREEPEGKVYARFKEARAHRSAASTDAERRRDEALSRNLAEDIMKTLGKKRIRRHLEGDWIRSQIRQEGGRVYVPAVLRNTLIPTKVLIEVANMTNPADCERLTSPMWRQSFAEAYVEALKSYYGF